MLFDKFVKNLDLGDMVGSSKGMKTNAIAKLLSNPDDFYLVAWMEKDAINLTLRKKPEEEESAEK